MQASQVRLLLVNDVALWAAAARQQPQPAAPKLLRAPPIRNWTQNWSQKSKQVLQSVLNTKNGIKTMRGA